MTKGLPRFNPNKKQFDAPKPQKTDLQRMIRVNQAGEFGAKRIYEGQLAILGGTPEAPIIRHMLNQELEHLDRFNDLMIENQVRPTVLTPLWRMAGFALGAVTARMGKESAMACTEAVEDVIDQHYAAQEQELGSENMVLKKLISKCREEENEHKELSITQGAREASGYPVLSRSIKAATRIAIWLSSRI